MLHYWYDIIAQRHPLQDVFNKAETGERPDNELIHEGRRLTRTPDSVKIITLSPSLKPHFRGPR